MSEFMSEANRALSPQALDKLKMLSRDHGLNADLIRALKTCPDEARAHIRLFKRMMYMTNGIFMLIGIGLVRLGLHLQGLRGGFSLLVILSLIAGCLLFLKYLSVFLSMRRAINVTEAVALRYELI